MNTFLWVIQALLAVVLLFAGWMKFFGIEKILKDAAPRPGKLSLTRPMVHFIGISEFAGSLGVILPGLTQVMPQLTPIAVAGLTVVMILATGFHIQRKDPARSWYMAVCRNKVRRQHLFPSSFPPGPAAGSFQFDVPNQG